VLPAPPPARLTSSQERRGRTDSQNRSKAGSVMSSSTPSCSPQLRRRNSWPTVGAGSTTHSGDIRPPGAYAPGGRPTGSCSMTTPTHSHKAWSEGRGYVTLTGSFAYSERSHVFTIWLIMVTSYTHCIVSTTYLNIMVFQRLF